MARFPTETDLRFYESKHRPRWSAPLIAARDRKQPKVEPFALIDAVVNAHAGSYRPTSGELAAHNLLAIIRSTARREPARLVERLNEIAHTPGCLINPEKRAAFARRWARRVQEGRSR